MPVAQPNASSVLLSCLVRKARPLVANRSDRGTFAQVGGYRQRASLLRSKTFARGTRINVWRNSSKCLAHSRERTPRWYRFARHNQREPGQRHEHCRLF